MKTKTINIFPFSELSEDAKQKALSNYSNINNFDGRDSFILEDWQDKLSRQGFEEAEINYTGFYNQGDGASFSASVNLDKFLKGRRSVTKYAKELKLYEETGDNIVIKNGGHYYHEMTMSINSDNLSSELEAFILEEARNQARAMYKELHQSYGNITSEQAIAEAFEANDYYFNENGKIEN